MEEKNLPAASRTADRFAPYIAAIAAFVVFFIVGRNAPLASDDWVYRARNLGHLRDFIEYALYYGNGRFLGNLFAMCFVQKPLLSALFRAATLAGIVFLLPRVCRVKAGMQYYLAFLLMAGTAPTLFAQVYGWTSGFMNYTPEILCMLLCLFLFGGFDGAPEKRWASALRTSLMLPAAFSGQLFVEHASFVMVLIAGVCLFFAVKKKQKRLRASLFFAGTLAGGAAMILIPRVFFDPYNTQIVYRSFSLGGPLVLIGRVWTGVLTYSHFLSGSALLFLVLGAAALAVPALYPNSFLQPKLLAFCRAALAGYPVYALVNNLFLQNGWYVIDNFPRYFISFLLLFPFLFALVYVLHRLPDAVTRRRALTCIALALLSVCPLLLATVLAERCILLPYTFLVMAALTVLESLLPALPAPVVSLSRRAVGLASAALSLCLALAFFNIGKMDRMLLNHIETRVAEGATEVDLYPIPYNYVFGQTDTWAYAQVYYHEKRGDVIFENIDIPRWEKRRLRERQAAEKEQAAQQSAETPAK